MTDRPFDVIRLRGKRRFRLIDCQGEGHLMSSLKDSVQLLHPGIDIQALLLRQDKQRRQKAHEDAWAEWVDASKKLCRVAIEDPLPDMRKHIETMQDGSHE